MIYEYECQICTQRTTAIRSMADRHNGPECCGQMMEKRIFTATRFQGVEWNVDYFCPSLGTGISSKKQRENIMKRRGLAYADEFEQPDFEAMEAKSREVKESAMQEPEIPPDLKEAMVREGHADLL